MLRWSINYVTVNYAWTLWISPTIDKTLSRFVIINNYTGPMYQ